MEQFEKDYRSQCTVCGDRNFYKVKAWINDLTTYTLIGQTYLSANQVKYIFEQIEDEEVTECKCECELCGHCDSKENE
jgi:hypothetical protein